MVADAVGLLRVRLNNGAGTFFAASISLASSSTPEFVRVADVSGDGHLDLISGKSTGIGIFLGDGLGGFSAETEYTGVSSGLDLWVGHFNGDSFLDIAQAAQATDQVAIFLGTGGGVFAPPSFFATADSPFAVTALDVDLDGIIDLVSCSSTSPGEVSFLKGTGVGTFLPKVAVANLQNGRVFSVGDFNGGGALDFLVGSEVTSSTTIFLTDVLTPTTSELVGTDIILNLEIINVNVADMTSVGFSYAVPSQFTVQSIVPVVGSRCTDVMSFGPILSLFGGVVPGSSSCIYRVKLETIAGGETSRIVTVTSNVPSAASNTAVFTVTLPPPPTVVLSFRSVEPVAALTASSTIPSTAGQIWGTAVGDFNHDGILDFVTANDAEDKVTYHLGVGDGTFDAGTDMGSQGNNANSVAVADFNQDTWDDFAVVNRVSNNFVVFINDQLGGFQVGTQYNGVTTAGRAIETGDFNEGKEKLCGCICLIIVLRRFSRYCGC